MILVLYMSYYELCKVVVILKIVEYKNLAH